MKELIAIQSELKAPKGQTNNFGKYKYRSCEDILEAVKPLCIKHNCLLTISDEMIMLGDRFYVKATASISTSNKEYDVKNEESLFVDRPKIITVSAYAREALSKKGMDESQITGSASSYARKYALNGLFCIDDTKDADTMDNTAQPQQKAPKQTYDYKKATPEQYKLMNGYMKDFTARNDSKSVEYIAEHLAKDDLSKEQADVIIEKAKKALL